MQDSQSNKQEEIICTCTGTTKNKVKQLIAKGADDYPIIFRASTCEVNACESIFLGVSMGKVPDLLRKLAISLECQLL